ncbi:hypothetical protein MKX50_17775 [Paenibacillus sp. FSL W8-0186]|uniref:Uncharacterized protein n=1 Tax=Paenibacillus woosongensis TaxID=307580 RepID=A0ABQ4MNH1_9BACL|nr:hypothetical protein [Paenibacillus woosongensis]GIP57561.1 hypothetical protein J15TS10_13750 [Paenibacillus woosongensis]
MEITILISIATAVSGILLGWLGRTRTIRQDAAKDAEAGATLQTDVEYIKRGVDDIRVDMRIQSQRLDGISERVTRVEESTKQAHKRLDRLEE